MPCLVSMSLKSTSIRNGQRWGLEIIEYPACLLWYLSFPPNVVLELEQCSLGTCFMNSSSNSMDLSQYGFLKAWPATKACLDLLSKQPEMKDGMQVIYSGRQSRLGPGRVKHKGSKINKRMCLPTGHHCGWLVFNPTGHSAEPFEMHLRVMPGNKQSTHHSSVPTLLVKDCPMGIYLPIPPGCACISANLILTGTPCYGI